MRYAHRGNRSLAVLLLAVMVLPLVTSETLAQGRIVEFQIEPFDDTLFAGIDGAYRTAFDADGDLWYTTVAGVVNVDVEAHTRTLYTRMDGLPSSYALGLAVHNGLVYVGTDLGLAIIDPATGVVTQKERLNTPFPYDAVQEILPIGEELWMGTYFGGVSVWNMTSDTWTTHNTSTTSSYAKPVRRITTSPEAIWVATNGDGVWRVDRDSGAWTPLLTDDGLATNNARAALQVGRDLYVASEKGLQVRRAYEPFAGTDDEWVTFDTTNSRLPSNLTLDIDVLPIEEGGFALFASTRDGMWRYRYETGEQTVLAQAYGILGDFILDNNYSPTHGWAVATERGVSLYREGAWQYFVTGPSAPEAFSSGPDTVLFTSASVGDGGHFLWFGGNGGVNAYLPATGDTRGRWLNFGSWSEYPGGPVNWIDTDGDITWVASNTGVFGLRHEYGDWIERKATASRNLVYGVEADRGELYVPLFGDGLIMQNLTTGATRVWSATSVPPLPDLYLTDARAQANDLWLGSSVGVIRMDRATGEFPATYTVADGIPGTGVVFRVLPEGPLVWIATKDSGVALLDTRAGRVTKVWNETTTPGFPAGEVRSLHRADKYLWAGTTEGLVRIDTASGAIKTYATTNSGLVQNFVNGMTSRDGILYMATLSGIARLDIASDAFLPMQEGEGARDVDGSAARAPAAPSVRVSILSPTPLALVSGVTTISGSAFAAGGASVERVEVQVGDGEWQVAEGTASWSIPWDTTGLPKDETIAVRARAIGTNETSREAEVLAVPIEPPTTPLTVEALAPPAGTAGRDLVVAARVSGDPPITARVLYRANNASRESSVELVQDGSIWRGVIPGSAVHEGTLTFYVQATAGRETRTDPPDKTNPLVVNVTAAPVLAVDLTVPSSIEATAGEPTTAPLRVENTGTDEITITLGVTAEGPASRWVSVPGGEITLAPGEARSVDAAVSVESGAFAQVRNVTIAARDASGVADPAVAQLRLDVKPSTTATTPATPTDSGGGFDVPAPSIAWLVATLAAAAIVGHRRRSA